ncbi:FliH/SctL family protein [Pleomorphomonas sp. PLEO]|uniref:FliH/SctL family protein n=1 Tax=Pleomorphomonas sp. PLEO TaxID=3239306 RepID=UPI00351F0432
MTSIFAKEYPLMAAPARFLFDNDFSAPASRADGSPTTVMIPEPEHLARLTEAEDAAYQRGLAAGRESAEAQAADRTAREATRLSDEAQRLASAAQSILAVLDTERARIEADAVRLAETVAIKIAGSLVDRQPRERILGLLEDCFSPLRAAPHLVIRLSDTDAEPIQSELKRLVAERGFEGRLVVLGEPGMARGDCRIEWADGGIVLDHAAIIAGIEAAIARHLPVTEPTNLTSKSGATT